LALLGDVVVVSIQYRLGTFGFLSLPDGEGGHGNFGLKDQRYAMEWVQKNIANFGGNPNNVMVFGESAGGISMCYHLTSPGSAGLFRSLAMESGSCNMQVQSLVNGLEMARSFATKQGCKHTTMEDTKRCLVDVEFKSLVYPVGNETEALRGNECWVAPAFPWCMTVDGQRNGVVAPALVMLEKGRFNRVNTILGSNTNEFQCACAKSEDTDSCLFADTLPRLLPEGNLIPYSEDSMQSILRHFLKTNLSDALFQEVHLLLILNVLLILSSS